MLGRSLESSGSVVKVVVVDVVVLVVLVGRVVVGCWLFVVCCLLFAV